MKLLRRKHSNILLSGIALILLLGFLWSYTESGSTPAFKTAKKNPAEPDFFIIKTTSKSYDEQGQLSSILSTPKLEHFPANNTTHLDKPDIKLFDNKQQTWQINAKSGIVHGDGKKIELKDNVIIVDGGNQYKLTTNALNLLPDKKLANNNVPVTLTSPEGSTTAVGLKADLNKEHLLLKKRVRGQYHVAP